MKVFCVSRRSWHYRLLIWVGSDPYAIKSNLADPAIYYFCVFMTLLLIPFFMMWWPLQMGLDAITDWADRKEKEWALEDAHKPHRRKWKMKLED